MFQIDPIRTLETDNIFPTFLVNLETDKYYILDFKDLSAGVFIGSAYKTKGVDTVRLPGNMAGKAFNVLASNLPGNAQELHFALDQTITDGYTVPFETIIGEPPEVTPTKVAGIVRVDSVPAGRLVRCFTYDSETMNLLNRDVFAPRPLGETESDPETGEYELIIESGYTGKVFVLAFDDYGTEFSSDLAVEVGDRVRPTEANGFVYVCTAAGTLPTTEPEWSTDTETSVGYGSASMIATPFFQPTAQGPVIPVESETSNVNPMDFVTAGNDFSTVVAPDKTVLGFGRSANNRIAVPQGLSGVKQISTANEATLALLEDGSIVAWGNSALDATNIPAGLGPVRKIAAGNGGYAHVLLMEDGSLQVIGYASSQLQTGIPQGNDFVDICCGQNHALAKRLDGSLVGWGANNYNCSTIPDGVDTAIAFDAGSNYSILVKPDRTVVAWGWNTDGQATPPAGLSDVIAVNAYGSYGKSTSVALKADGTVVCWGGNDEGQRDVPAGLSDVVAIAAGNGHVLAVKSTGEIVGWGRNAYGQLNPPDGFVARVS